MNDDDDDMTAEEFDRRLEAGQPVELHVAIARTKAPLYVLSVSHGGGVAAAAKLAPSVAHTGQTVAKAS